MQDFNDRESVWDVAHKENFDRDHAAALIEHDRHERIHGSNDRAETIYTAKD